MEGLVEPNYAIMEILLVAPAIVSLMLDSAARKYLDWLQSALQLAEIRSEHRMRLAIVERDQDVQLAPA